MEASGFIQQLREILPLETHSWVLSALREDCIVWQALQQSDLAGKAFATCGSQPLTWNPGLLSLLAMDLTVSQEFLQATPLKPLETEFAQKANQAYEQFTNRKQESEAPKALLPDQQGSDPSGNPPISNPSPVEELADAGWVSLALREKLCLNGSWKNFALDILSQGEVPVEKWATPLACLFGFIPDPIDFMSAFIYPSAPVDGISLALHSFLSNPLPNTDRLVILQETLSQEILSQETLSSQQNAHPSNESTAAALRILSLQQEELAQDLAEWLVDQENFTFHGDINSAEKLSLEQLEEIVFLAEIHQIAGQTDKALVMLSKAQQLTHWLQAELAAYWATTAESGQLVNNEENDQAAISDSWKEAVEWTPASFCIEGNSPFEAGFALAELRAKENSDIESSQSENDEEGFSNDHSKDWRISLAMGKNAQHLGDLAKAKQYASQAVTAAQDLTGKIKGSLLEPLQTIILRTSQESCLELGKLLYELGLYEESLKFLENAASASPNDPELLFQLGKALQASYKQIEANHTFELALMLAPARLDIHQSLAEGLESIENWDAALTERLSIFESIQPEDQESLIEAYHALAHCALKAGKLDLVVSSSEKAISIDPEDGLAYFFLGEAALEQSDLKSSLEHFNQAVQFSPQLPEPWLGLVKAYRVMEDENKVVDTLKEAVQAAPLSYEIHYSLGETYLSQDAQTQASMCFQRAYELVNTAQNQTGEFHWKIALQLGKVLYQLGHLNEANEVLGKAYQQFYFGAPQQSELAYAYAKTLLALGNTSQAVPVLREALKEDPQDTTPYLDYAKALLATGTDALEAVRVLQLALEKDPDIFEAQALLAEAFSAVGDHLRAMKAYQAALETELSKDRKWVSRLSFGMGSSALALGYIDTAIAALQEAIHADPNLSAYHKQLCEAYWAANLSNNAIQAARSALNLETENPNILLWFAQQAVRFYQFSNLKNQTSAQEVHCDDVQPERLYGIKPKQVLSEAMNALSQAAQIAPERADICLKLGELQVLAGERKNAAETYRQAISKETITLEELLTTADWLTQLGEDTATVACLERALSLLKADQGKISCDLLEKLAQAYLQAGHPESALETLRQAVGFYPQQVNLHLKIAQIFIKSGEVEDALSSLQDSLNILEDDADRSAIYYHIAQILRMRGELPYALSNAEHALQLSETPEVHEKFDWLHLAKHYLAAELARALLRTADARSFLEGRFHTLLTAEQLETIDPEILSTLLGYYCLKSELALEAGEEIEAANALTPAVQVAPTHPRSLALQSRFQHRRGDDNLALRTLHEALIQLPIPQELGGNGAGEQLLPSDRYPNPHATATGNGFSAADYLGLSEAAVELRLWEHAFYLIEKAIQANPQEQYLKLYLASLITRRAEYQYLCQELDVIKHAPGNMAHSPEQAVLSQRLIQSVKQALSQVNDTTALPNIKTWESRQSAVFEGNSKAQGNTTADIDWSALPQNEDTATAQMGYLLRKAALEQDSNPTNSQPDSQYSTAFLVGPQKDLETVLQISQTYPQSILVQILAGLFLETQQPIQGLHLVQRTASGQDSTLTGHTAMSYVLLARLAFKTSNYDLAGQAIDTALSIWPDEPRWHALAASISLQNEGDRKDAIIHLETAVQLEPQKYSHLVDLGLAYYQSAKNDPTQIKAALQAFEKSCQLEPNRPEGLVYMAETLLLENSSSSLNRAATLVDRAISLVLSGKEKEPPINYYLLRAEIAGKMDDPELTMEYAQKVLKVEPQNANAGWLSAQALEKLNRPGEALSVLEKVVHEGEEPLHFQVKKVTLSRQSQPPEVSLKMVREIAERNPDQPVVLSLLAHILKDAGQKEAALQAAQLALKLYPNQPDLSAQEKAQLHYLIGMQSVENGQLDNAIHHLNETIETDPKFVEPYLELGFAYTKQRQYLKARNIFQQATRIAPDDPRPFLHTGLALKEGKDYVAAETMLRKAAQLAPSDIQIRKHLAAVAALNLVHNPHNLHIGAGQ